MRTACFLCEAGGFLQICQSAIWQTMKPNLVFNSSTAKKTLIPQFLRNNRTLCAYNLHKLSINKGEGVSNYAP